MNGGLELSEVNPPPSHLVATELQLSALVLQEKGAARVMKRQLKWMRSFMDQMAVHSEHCWEQGSCVCRASIVQAFLKELGDV
jgi:hypothetical protein